MHDWGSWVGDVEPGEFYLRSGALRGLREITGFDKISTRFEFFCVVFSLNLSGAFFASCRPLFLI